MAQAGYPVDAGGLLPSLTGQLKGARISGPKMTLIHSFVQQA